jgi:hypothetical protein
MASSVFFDKSAPPDDRGLAEALGASFKIWAEIKASLAAEHGPIVEEWKYYGPKIGWTLKSFLKKRNLFFMTPGLGYFRVSFVFGNKAVAAVAASALPQTMISELRKAKKYAEGRGLRLEVRTRRDAGHVRTLAAIKIEN